MKLTSTAKLVSHGRISVTAELNHKIGPIDRGDRYEDPLEEALKQHGYGEIDGGGTLQSKEGEIELIDVHMSLVSPDSSVPFVIELLESCGAPKGSEIRIHGEGDTERVIPFGVREGYAIYLDGINLPENVYRNSDINFVISELDKLLAEHGRIEANWQGPTETALYIYGDSIPTMKALVGEFMASYPLCKGARIVNLTQ